jgi:endonuclease/exonuclease/phosphatase family metal-dependent hydrolase
MSFGIPPYAFRAAQSLALALLSTACVTAGVITLPAQPALLAALTWNMDAGRGDLPRLVADLETGRLGTVPAQELVLLLQEAVQSDVPRLTQLAEARGWSMLFVPVHHDGRRMRGNAMLSTQPLRNARAIPLPRERQPRVAAAAAIAAAGEELFVVSAHLENRVSWWKAGLLSDGARGRQADALVRALPADAPGIVGGDFNTWLGQGEPAWRLLARRFDDTPAARMPTFAARLILDHVFVDVPEGWRATTSVVDDTYGSDHHPVLATITTVAARTLTRALYRHGCRAQASCASLSASSHAAAR